MERPHRLIATVATTRLASAEAVAHVGRPRARCRSMVRATGVLCFALLLMSCTGGVGACGRTSQATPPASATTTQAATPSGADTTSQLPPIASRQAGTSAAATSARPPAQPPGLGTLGELPSIAPTPAGTPDVAAAALAKQVLAGDAGSLPALMRAIDLAGFTIRHAGKTVQAPSGASQGIVFEAWEVQALSKLMRDGLATSFGETAALFAMTTKETETVPFESLMYDGIRTSAAATNPALRFWARFIVELGFQGPGAYDLFGDKTPAKVNMDPVQIAFIFKRLAGDLAVVARNHAPKPAKAPDGQPAVWTGGAPSLVFASLGSAAPIDTLVYTPIHAPRMRTAPLLARDARSAFLDTREFRIDARPDARTDARADSRTGARPGARPAPWDGDGEDPSPCAVEGVDKEIQDVGAAADNFGFGLLMGRLEKQWGFAEATTISKATGVANMALAYLKLAATIALFDARITMDGAGPPLTRTRSTTAHGDRRKLTVTVKMDHSNVQWVNCLRPMINRIGMDFDVPNAGPVADAEVNWELIRPRPSTLGGVSYGIVQFVGTDPVHRTDPVHGTDNITNKMGQASIDIEGIKQRQAISPSAQQVRKEAKVYAHVKLKPASFYQDMKDVIISSGLGLDPLSGIVTLPAELMYRTNWLFGGGYVFDVIDWSQGFTGSIIAVEQGRMDRQKGGGRDAFGFWSMSATYRDERTLTVTGSSDMSPYSPEIGYASAKLDVSVDTANVEEFQCKTESIARCGDPWKPPGSRTVPTDGGSQRYRLSIGETTQQPRAVYVRIFADGHYDIQISLDAERQVGEYTSTKDTFVDNAACTLQTITKNGPSKGTNRSFDNTVTVTGFLDPDNPRVLKGSQILRDYWVDPKHQALDGCQGSARINTTITIFWELAI